MKIKTFRFRTWNCANNSTSDADWAIRGRKEVISLEEVDNIVNEFMSNHSVVDVKVNQSIPDFSNNGYGNSIDTTYTILYNE